MQIAKACLWLWEGQPDIASGVCKLQACLEMSIKPVDGGLTAAPLADYCVCRFSETLLHGCSCK